MDKFIPPAHVVSVLHCFSREKRTLNYEVTRVEFAADGKNLGGPKVGRVEGVEDKSATRGVRYTPKLLTGEVVGPSTTNVFDAVHAFDALVVGFAVDMSTNQHFLRRA